MPYIPMSITNNCLDNCFSTTDSNQISIKAWQLVHIRLMTMPIIFVNILYASYQHLKMNSILFYLIW